MAALLTISGAVSAIVLVLVLGITKDTREAAGKWMRFFGHMAETGDNALSKADEGIKSINFNFD